MSNRNERALRRRRVFAVLACAAFALLANASAQTPQAARSPTRAVDPITGIVDAFKTHSIVALGEGGHGNEQGHRFRLTLIRDPRFSAVVTDVVVEFGNARYQPLMDRFVNGENIDDSELRRVWQDTTQLNTVWDTPIYEEFFRTVREVNSSLPAERRLRVLLGDPPIVGGVRAFNIWTVTGADLRTLQSDVAAWPTPSLGVLNRTTLGGVRCRDFWPAGPVALGPDGQPQSPSPGSLRPWKRRSRRSSISGHRHRSRTLACPRRSAPTATTCRCADSGSRWAPVYRRSPAESRSRRPTGRAS